MKELLLNVEGMHCGGCEKRIQNAVSDIDGVENVEASFEAGTVKVTLNKVVDEKAIKETIEDMGFEVK